MGLAMTINEGTLDSTVHVHNDFGQVLQSSTVRREKGRLVRQFVSTYTYTDNRYLNNRTDRLTVVAPNGISTTSTGTFVYEYAGTPRRIQAIRRVNLSGTLDVPATITFQYTGDQLTQYAETDANATPTYQATFGPDGRLSGVQRSSLQRVAVANGLISQTILNKDTVRYSYDQQGQLTMQETSVGTTGERIQRTLTYDGRLPQRTGELRLPGFPTSDLTGFGRGASNVLTETTRRFRNNFLIETTTLRYTYAYNPQGYPTGYARSDGARAQFYYTNCP